MRRSAASWVPMMRFCVVLVAPCVPARVSAAAAFQCPRLAQAPADDVGIVAWRPPDGVPHGVQEFHRTTRVVMPAGVSRLDVEVWGAGGGGGGGSSESYSEGGAGGGGGASGGYARLSIEVDPGGTYVFVVGQRGAGGRIGAPGDSGGASGVCRGAAVIGVVPGGTGGGGAVTNEHGGKAGTSGTGTASALDAPGLRRAGNGGAKGLRPLFHLRGAGGRGGAAVAGAAVPQGSAGGAGGSGEMRPLPPQPGAAGGDGLIVIRW